MAIVRRIRPENDIARPLRFFSAGLFFVVSTLYVLMLVLAFVALLLLVLALSTDIPSLNKVSQNEWPLITLFVSSGGIGSFLVQAANREHKRALLHRVLDDMMQRPQTKANDAAIQAIIQKLLE